MLAIHWFENNQIKLNTDKFHLIVLANIGTNLIWESNDVKLLEIAIERDLKFDKRF